MKNWNWVLEEEYLTWIRNGHFGLTDTKQHLLFLLTFFFPLVPLLLSLTYPLYSINFSIPPTNWRISHLPTRNLPPSPNPILAYPPPTSLIHLPITVSGLPLLHSSLSIEKGLGSLATKGLSPSDKGFSPSDKGSLSING